MNQKGQNSLDLIILFISAIILVSFLFSYFGGNIPFTYLYVVKHQCDYPQAFGVPDWAFAGCVRYNSTPSLIEYDCIENFVESEQMCHAIIGKSYEIACLRDGRDCSGFMDWARKNQRITYDNNICALCFPKEMVV